MIVREAGASLLLIRQTDHAALSERIMAAWKPGDLVPAGIRETVLLATREHDNGWIEVDAEPKRLRGTGRPFDFVNAPAAVKRGIWPRAVARLGATRPDAAALVAQHAITLFDGFREQDEWREFLTGLEQARNELLDRGARHVFGSMDAFLDAYRVVFLGDLLSLIFCCGWTRPFEEAGYRITLRDDRLTIAPDPFGGVEVALSITARAIPVRRYGSDHELQETVAAGELFELAGTAVGE